MPAGFPGQPQQNSRDLLWFLGFFAGLG